MQSSRAVTVAERGYWFMQVISPKSTSLGSRTATGSPCFSEIGASTGMKRLPLLAGRVARAEAHGKAAEETENAALVLLDLVHGRLDADLEAALLHDEGRGAVFALAANHFALLEMPAHDGIAIPAQERQGNAREERVLGQLFRTDGSPFFGESFADHGPVGQGPGRTGNHALAAGHAARAAHRIIEIEGDARRVALAHPAQDLVVPDFIAAADAAVAENAGVVVDADQERRIVARPLARAAAGNGCS